MTLRVGNQSLFTPVVATGTAAGVGTSFLDIWPLATAMNWLAAAAAMQISSSSASDALAGTGARTVLVSGLDGDRVPVSETVELNGQTAVDLENTYLRILSIEVITAGSGGVNAGDIYVSTDGTSLSSGVPSTTTAIHGVVKIGENREQEALLSLKAGNRADVSLCFSADRPAWGELWGREEDGLWVLLARISTPGDQVRTPFVYGGPMVDFYARGKVVSSTGTVTALLEARLRSA